MSMTKQGVRDLNSIGPVNKSAQNHRRDKQQENCFHIFTLCMDESYTSFRRCERCDYEEDGI
jgi:hypothetical protein